MEVGKTQSLQVIEVLNEGYVLKDKEGDEVFLSKQLSESEVEIGDEIEVFIFQDEGLPKATSEKPYCELNQYAVMHCVETMPTGAFMDWGISKDLFIPYKQQKSKIVEGKKYLVHVFLDEEEGRLTGTTKFKRNAHYSDFPLEKGTEVSIILMNETDLGWNVIINKQYIGLLYYSDIFKKLYPLNTEKAFIKTIREDGKIDVSLQPEGFEHIDQYRQKILEELAFNYGTLHLSDKSDPEDIRDVLQMSKKNFKKAIGTLYKDKKIEILPDRITLLK